MNQNSYDTIGPDGMVNITPPDYSGKNHEASKTWAWITRAQWADYLNRFAPREDQLLDMATYDNPALARSEIEAAKQTAGQAYDASARMGEQYFSRYGAGAISGQAESQARGNSLGKSAAIVDAANRITQKLIDQNRAIAVGAGNSVNAVQNRTTNENNY
jgi:hypothetical protein